MAGARSYMCFKVIKTVLNHTIGRHLTLHCVATFREDSGFTRLQAAKNFFEAFANRSQAYDFHHSVGLTIFNTKITITQKLTKIYEFFRVST